MKNYLNITKIYTELQMSQGKRQKDRWPTRTSGKRLDLKMLIYGKRVCLYIYQIYKQKKKHNNFSLFNSIGINFFFHFQFL